MNNTWKYILFPLLVQNQESIQGPLKDCSIMKQRKEHIVNSVFTLGKRKMTATLTKREGTALSLQNNVKYLNITAVSVITLKHVIKEFSQCSIFLQSTIMANYWFLSLSILLFLGFSKSRTARNISEAHSFKELPFRYQRLWTSLKL